MGRYAVYCRKHNSEWSLCGITEQYSDAETICDNQHKIGIPHVKIVNLKTGRKA